MHITCEPYETESQATFLCSLGNHVAKYIYYMRFDIFSTCEQYFFQGAMIIYCI